MIRKQEHEPATFEADMKHPKKTSRPALQTLLLSGLTTIALCAAIGARLQAQESPRDKALQTIDRSIDALGGERYRQVETVFHHGNYFRFDRNGRRSRLVKYWEWLQYDPIKWYFQIGSGNRQVVTVYNLELNKGWKKEGKGYIEDLHQEDIDDFLKQARHELDIVLRRHANDHDYQIFYYGPDEVTGGGHYEAVEFLDRSNDSVVVYFDLDSHLPARMEYHQTDKLGNRRQFSEEYVNWHEFNGVQHPLRIDYFIEGQLFEQRHITEAQIDPVVPPGQFLEPPIKKKKK